ncbi:DinB family protein [Kutzneria sp. CA-103260]|uniref:DinB family protein n=1 Tax=Kutzneria sp. CA-103260 TaxID=2802641 RepID=UPI001BA6E788|nr:DinB family protein [Kutzneria sp. CA-103260]QUQ68614.1 DinB family protein [Kutzneria sp. CA-103260]
MTENTDMLAELAKARNALIRTVDGLTDEQAGKRTTVSELCLGGVIKHVAAIEEQWLRFVVEGPSAMPYDLPEGVTWPDIFAGKAQPPQWMIDHRNDFQMLPDDTLADVLARYEQVAARTTEIVTDADLDATQPLPAAPWLEPGGVRSARRILVHVIAETSQHAGQADILRESLDGQKSS